MSISSIKKVLLAGTAPAAIAAFSFVAAAAFPMQAQAATATLTTNTTWASAGTHTSSPSDGTAAAAGDSVNTNDFLLAIANNGTANDGSGLNTFSVGAISGTGASDGVAVVNGSANNIAVTIASVNETGVGNEGAAFLNALQGTGAATNSNTTTITGNFLTAGPVAISNTDTTSAATVSVTVDGVMTATGTGVGINGGTFNGANGILTLKGAGVNALAPVTLIDGSTSANTGHAELIIAGTAAQTISGTIDGGSAGEGTLIVSNTSGGVTFSNAIGSIASLREINAGVAGTATAFNAAVNAQTLKFTGTGTVSFGTQAYTGNINFEGNTGTVTLSNGTITGNIDTTTANTGTVTITGAGTVTGNVGSSTTDTLAAVNAGMTGTTMITGSVYATDLNVTGTGTVALGGTLAGALAYGANNGVVTVADGANIEGAVTATNAGTLTLSGTNTVSGNIGNLGALNAGQSGGTSTLSGTVNATAINIGTGTADFGKTVTGAIDFGGNNGAVIVASGANIVGAVDSIASPSGTLTLAGGTQSVSGGVGATNALTQVNAGQSGGTTAFDNLVKSTTLDIGTGEAILDSGFTGTAANFTGNGTLQLGAGQTLTGSVTTATAGTGNFDFAGNGTVTGTFGGGTALKTLTVGGTGTTATINGNITAANTTSVGGNMLMTSSAFTMAAGQTLVATITGAATNGSVAATGVATLPAGATVNLLVDSSYHPAVGAFGGTYTIVTSAAGGGIDPAVTITSSPLYTFTQVANANNLQVTAMRNSMASVTTSPNTTAVGTALDTIGTTGNAALTAVQADINAAPTKAALNNVLSSLTPTVDGGAQNSILEVGAAIEDIADTRMDALRSDDGTTGYASGYFANGSSLWVQGYGQSATQSERDLVAGYKATTAGTAIGADTADLFDEGIVGLMFNYGVSNVDSDNANTTKTTVDNYGLNLYGTGFLLDRMFLEWQAGYSYNKISSIRHDVGAPGIDATGDANSREYNTRLELGKDYDVAYGTVFTPDANATFVHLNTGGYQETGSGANLNVSANSQDELDFGVGAKMTWLLRSYYGPVMKPMVHVGYSYAAIDDRVETTSTFAGAAPGTNPSFVTQGPTPERSRFDIGAGLAYWTLENWELSANTNYEYRTDYHAYSGILRATAHF